MPTAPPAAGRSPCAPARRPASPARAVVRSAETRARLDALRAADSALGPRHGRCSTGRLPDRRDPARRSLGSRRLGRAGRPRRRPCPAGRGARPVCRLVRPAGERARRVPLPGECAGLRSRCHRGVVSARLRADALRCHPLDRRLGPGRRRSVHRGARRRARGRGDHGRGVRADLARAGGTAELVADAPGADRAEPVRLDRGADPGRLVWIAEDAATHEPLGVSVSYPLDPDLDIPDQNVKLASTATFPPPGAAAWAGHCARCSPRAPPVARRGA